MGATARDIYAAALDMVAWADTRGCASVLLSEHDISEDGYLPSPLVMAAAIAARTTQAPIVVAVAILPLYQPVRLAEEIAVLDVLSGGRVMFVLAIGYRREEYEMHGIDFQRRRRLADELLPLVFRAKAGEPFEHERRHIQVTPLPLTSGGPTVSWGGGTVAAARRAGRHGIGFLAQSNDPELEQAYEAAAREAGREPGLCILNSPDDATFQRLTSPILQAVSAA